MCFRGCLDCEYCLCFMDGYPCAFLVDTISAVHLDGGFGNEAYPACQPGLDYLIALSYAHLSLQY